MSILTKLALPLAVAVTCVVSNVLMALWAKTGHQWLWIPILLLGAASMILFGFSLKRVNLSIAVILVEVLILMLTVLAGVLIYHDALTTRQVIGVVFALAAVVAML